MKVKVTIIDDEPRAHKIIEAYIARTPELELAGNFLNAITAYEFLKLNKVDLIFLDIGMPAVDGFAFLRMLHKPPMVVFTTAHPEFALESYDYDAVDYLKKPIPYDRFLKAVNKAMGMMPVKPPEALPDHISLKIGGEVRTIAFDSINYFQSLGNYIKVITDGKPLLTQATTAEIEHALPKKLFIRIHKSFIVNRAKIQHIDQDEVTLGNIKLPIGKTYKKYVTDSVSK